MKRGGLGEDLTAELDPSEPFDEIPLYSRDSDVAFFGGRPVREANEILIRYSARFLADVVGVVEPAGGEPAHRYLMVSLLEWTDCRDAGSTGRPAGSELLLVPWFWIGDLAHPAMRSFEMSAGTSMCARFAESSLGSGGEFRVYENFSTWSDGEVSARVYVEAVVAG
ncbi:hypothetical protein OG738_17075 [Amycolatopsis sp. NBC_01488]|uniref:hypothetical protein n=1 Tax=Amycolatopsis sp. NBC_01488 TaxID=2903563 RepID=UPI002E2A1866|nr:hypothetical protein [Amycolatopsis sp. NBC_01488]